MRRWLLVAVLLGTAVQLAPTPAGASDMTVGWINECSFSHRAKDDPIVYPDHPGASHSHDFYGNRSTDAFSTYQTLLHGTTTCSALADTAAYWVPTLYFHGEPQMPRNVKFYYRNIIDPPSDVRPFPRGFQIIEGNSHATGPQDVRSIWWQCDHGVHTVMPQNCDRGQHVVYHVEFPECWDGRLDPADHMSHMAPSVDRDSGRDTCPRDHPYPLPRLILRLEWHLRNGAGITLASGMPYTLHADFFNSWDQDRLRHLVEHCINEAIDCGVLGKST
jgi:Domain of unknown function (DUF1996)